MTRRVTRREFLNLAAGATALGLGARASAQSAALPAAADAPFDTVVVLTMENRSFDHMLGWLPGANGRQQGLTYPDKDGVPRTTWRLAPDFQGCAYLDPDHTWEGILEQYADGRCDGFLRTRSSRVGDEFAIGYYGEDDLPILSALAKGYTTFDSYFCSMMGPTWENRLYQLSGTTQLLHNCDFPKEGDPRPVRIPTTIFDRVRDAGLTTRYYYHAAPITGLFEEGRYESMSRPIERFWADAAAGELANVVFIDPDYSDLAEDIGTSNDYHPWGNVLVAEGLVARVHDALKASPQWDRMVFVLNFDEHGGFFDHVPPPECRDDTEIAELPKGFLKRLGFRVPAIAMGPFAPRKIEQAGPYEHCSILRMIEWRWGLEPLTTRDRNAKNLANALDFTRRRAAIALPPFAPPPPTACFTGGNWIDLQVSPASGLVQVPVELEDTEEGRVCSARLLWRGEELANAPEQTLEVSSTQARTCDAAGRLLLPLTVTAAGRRLLIEKPSRLPALLETHVLVPGAPVCRSTSPVLLRLGPLRARP